MVYLYTLLLQGHEAETGRPISYIAEDCATKKALAKYQ